MDKKEKLLQAGMDLFSKYGYQKVSIDELVTRAGIAKGTFYLYFKDKDDLYHTLVHQIFAQGMQHMQTLRQKYPVIAERLFGFFVGGLFFFAHYPLLQNIKTLNPNYFSPTVTLEHIKEHHSEMLDILLDSSDYHFLYPHITKQDVGCVASHFLDILQYKNTYPDEKSFYAYVEKYANILVRGLVREQPRSFFTIESFLGSLRILT